MNENIVVEREKEENRNVVVLYHHDVDGLASASLILRAVGHVDKFLSHDPNESFPEIYATDVFIVDIAVTPKTWESVQNIHSSKITWIDHHKLGVSLPSNIPTNLELILDSTSPANVLIVQKYFNLTDTISQQITDLGVKADTWTLSPTVQDWMDLDTAFSIRKRDKTPLILALTKGKIEISGRLRRTLESYRRAKEEAKKKLLKNVIIRNINGHLVAIGLAPSMLSGSEACAFMETFTGAEVQFAIKYPGWGSIRRKKTSTVNLLTIANILGGGGHEYSAGFELHKHVNTRNFKVVVEEIFEKISQAL